RLIPGTNIAAIGDITPGPMLAHKGTAEGIVAAEAVCGKRSAFDPAAIPLVVFSDPQVTSAGHTEASAREAGLSATAVTVPTTALSGRVARVTGGGRGIGRAVALALGRAGAAVAVNYRRDEDAAAQVVKDITAAGGTAGAYPASVGDLDALDGLVAAVAADLG